MYAIVEIAGQQFKVAKDQKVYVHRLQGEAGSKITFDNVLLLDNEGSVVIGAPAIEGASVTAQILSHLKGDKVIVFKKKRRKGYQKKNGHRQYLSEIQIESIAATGEKKSAKKAAATFLCAMIYGFKIEILILLKQQLIQLSSKKYIQRYPVL